MGELGFFVRRLFTLSGSEGQPAENVIHLVIPNEARNLLLV